MKTGVSLSDESINEGKRRISFSVSTLTPRIIKARSKSVTHVSSKYESLDYDAWANDLLTKEEQSKAYKYVIKINVIRWILYLITGLLTGMIAVFIDISIEHMLTLKTIFLKNYMGFCFDKSCSYLASISWYLAIIVPALIGSLIVIFIEPTATGSGIPLVISHLNGVRIPRFTSFRALIIKICSVICCGVARLAAGKEGPFIHIGATVASLVSSIRFPKIPYLFDKTFHFHSVLEERDLMSGGVAAGVSAAFGSPVGATLMSLEEGTSFWSVVLMWRIFFCAIFSCFSFNTAINLYYGYSGQHTYMGLFYFGKFNETLVNYEYYELPIFFSVGIIGGLLGALFVVIQLKLSTLRTRYLSTKLLKIADILAVSFLTAALGVLSMYLLHTCSELKPHVYEPGHTLRMYCEDGKHNEMSVFWFQSQEHLVRLLFHSPPETFNLLTLITYFVIYFILFSITAGTSISVGIFIPSLLLGATWGRIVGVIVRKMFPQLAWTVPAKYALLGAAAQLGGVVRITISLTVVIIEATGTLTFGFPLMLTLFITKWVGDFFIEGLYETQINLLGIPTLPEDPPPLTSDITAKDLMNTKVVAFPMLVSVEYLFSVLEQTAHQGFPVVKEVPGTNMGDRMKMYGELRGFILRSQLITLLVTKTFSVPTTTEEIREILKLFRKYELTTISTNDINLTEEENNTVIDLRPYMNPSPYSVQMVMSFPRVFRLLRSVGLRHVIVIDNKNRVMGIITRKDLAKFRLWRYAITMGLKELRVQ